MSARVDSERTDRFEFERKFWQQGVPLVAGVDEAGRGPLAGPVVAAAVILPATWGLLQSETPLTPSLSPSDGERVAEGRVRGSRAIEDSPSTNDVLHSGFDKRLLDLNDSKQLTAAQRETFFQIIITHPEIRFAIAIVDAPTIDRINILQATHRAMNEALAQLKPSPQHVLVDGRPVKSMTLSQTALVKGDSRSYSIAAASVLAKVTRDRLMLDYHRQFPDYGFAEHKGYGTPQHLAAIEKLGPCPIHRLSFAPLKVTQPELL